MRTVYRSMSHHGTDQRAVGQKAQARCSCCASRCSQTSSVKTAVHACAGDGDEVLAPSEGIDTNGVKGADVATPPGAETVDDPNGAAAAVVVMHPRI